MYGKHGGHDYSPIIYIYIYIYIYIFHQYVIIFTHIDDYSYYMIINTHRIHGAGIYANIGGILMGSMLPYIAAPWILWNIMAGWWFGTFFIFPYIGNNHPNWLIFFRGVEPPTRWLHSHSTIFHQWIFGTGWVPPRPSWPKSSAAALIWALKARPDVTCRCCCGPWFLGGDLT